jgi:tripartite-type tricarboxylate transporter receptor subunit TctC
MVMLAQALGVTFDMIPYRGGGPALNDNLAGHIDLHTASLMAAAPHIQAGALKGFGLTSAETVEALPHVPSLVQLGLKQMDMPFWHGLFVPSATPRAVVERLNEAMRQAVNDPKVATLFGRSGLKAYALEQQTPEAATDLLRSEITRWREVIIANNIQAN